MGSCCSSESNDTLKSTTSRPLKTCAISCKKTSQRYELIEEEVFAKKLKRTKHAIMGGMKVRYAYISQKGYYPGELNKPNQDALSVSTNMGGGEQDTFLAVYDGHGEEGENCSQFAMTALPLLLDKQLEHERMKEVKARTVGEDDTDIDEVTFSSIDLTKEQIQRACRKAHLKCNKMLKEERRIDDSISGTTSISVYFHPPNRITVCNVGDSRAISGHKKKNAYRAMPLSNDQTPYRRDERLRVKKCGARVLSLEMIEGLRPAIDDDDQFDVRLGEEVDEWGDPPRVWHPTEEYPGCAFTRSIGDSIAEELGVHAEPEMFTKELTEEDKIIVLASDGVFEFLTNQGVIDICAKFVDPLDACQAIVSQAYNLWLQCDLRADDITIICVYVDCLSMPTPEEEPSVTQEKLPSIRSIRNASVNSILIDDEIPAEGTKPVRLAASRRFSNKIRRISLRHLTEDDLDNIDISNYTTEKTDEEKLRISDVIKGHLMFQNISKEQREMIHDAMQKQEVKKGQWIIKQGQVGDYFYIVDHGDFEVRVLPDTEEYCDAMPGEGNDGGDVVHVYMGTKGVHPSFGELALLHSIPRAASIIALSDGLLWALHRVIFKKILMKKSDRRELCKTLRTKINALKCLTQSDIETLSNVAEEVMFKEGDAVVEEGQIGDTFFFIVHGKCVRQDDNTKLEENDYFGESVLYGKRPYDYTIIATSTMKCLKLSLDAIEQQVDDLALRRVSYEARISPEKPEQSYQ